MVYRKKARTTNKHKQKTTMDSSYAGWMLFWLCVCSFLMFAYGTFLWMDEWMDMCWMCVFNSKKKLSHHQIHTMNSLKKVKKFWYRCNVQTWKFRCFFCCWEKSFLCLFVYGIKLNSKQKKTNFIFNFYILTINNYKREPVECSKYTMSDSVFVCFKGNWLNKYILFGNLANQKIKSKESGIKNQKNQKISIESRMGEKVKVKNLNFFVCIDLHIFFTSMWFPKNWIHTFKLITFIYIFLFCFCFFLQKQKNKIQICHHHWSVNVECWFDSIEFFHFFFTVDKPVLLLIFDSVFWIWIWAKRKTKNETFSLRFLRAARMVIPMDRLTMFFAFHRTKIWLPKVNLNFFFRWFQFCLSSKKINVIT